MNNYGIGYPFPPVGTICRSDSDNSIKIVNGQCPPGYHLAGQSPGNQGVPVQVPNLGQPIGNAISGILPDWTKSLSKMLDFLAKTDSWKGIGLMAGAVVLAIVGVVLWTGHGRETVQVSTTTGKRIVTGGS